MWYRAPNAATGAKAVVVDVIIGHPAVTYCVQLEEGSDRIWVGAARLALR